MREHIAGDTAIEFKREQADILAGPGVYLYMIEDEAIYVGSSRHLAWRCFKRYRNTEKARRECTSILLLPCNTERDARELESELISDLMPKYNNRLRLSKITKLLGLSSNSVTKRQYT